MVPSGNNSLFYKCSMRDKLKVSACGIFHSANSVCSLLVCTHAIAGISREGLLQLPKLKVLASVNTH